MSSIIYALIKVCSRPEFAESFRKGKLHFRKVKTFNAYEEPNEHLRGDEYEGIIGIFQPEKVKLEFNNTLIDSKGIVGPIQMHDKALLDKYMFCLYSINSKKWSTIREDEVDAFKLDMQIDESIFKLGDFSALVMNAEEFVNRVVAAVRAKSLRCRMGLVEYRNAREVNEVFPSGKAGFHKRLEYQGQNEFRIVMDSNVSIDDKPWNLDVGTLEDIAVLVPTKDLPKSLRMEMRE